MRHWWSGGSSLLALVALAVALWLIPAPALYPPGFSTGFSRAYLSRENQLLRLTLAADGRYRLYTPLDQISPALIAATRLYEDRWFDWHPGVNPVALMRAAWDLAAGSGRRGASTITMQLVRLRDRAGGLDTASAAGKLNQIARAFWLELHFSKREILEAYLNLAPYGGSVEGAGAASRIYFGKTSAQLTLAEALTLAVIPQNPTRRNPASKAGWHELDSARQRLAAAWFAEYPADAARAGELRLRLTVRTPAQLPFLAPHYVDALMQRPPLIAAPSGVVDTTLSGPLQVLLEQAVRDFLGPRRAQGLVNASALLLDWRRREVLALAGSADYFSVPIQGQVNGALAKRSPGSTLKPFLYALALQQGLIHPMSLMKDAPRRFGAYTPENSDRQFAGPVLARDALNLSRNVPAVWLLTQIKDDGLWNMLRQARVRDLRGARHYGLALALGGAELTMEEMASLYVMLAHLGQWQPLRWRTGESMPEPRPLLSPEAAFLTLEMLRGHPATDGIAALYPVYWKTGTSYSFRDAWAVGIAGPYVLAVWTGHFDGRGNPAFIGREAAAPLFFRIVRALARTQPRDFVNAEIAPSLLKVRQVEVCANTGDLPSNHCPRLTHSWFIPGVSPIRGNTIYRQVAVNARSGRRSCRHTPPITRLEVFEFWPSDLATLFRQAGVALKPPPDGDCAPRDGAGRPPEIQAPDARTTHLLSPRTPRLHLSATADAGVSRLHWFADDAYLGASAPGQALDWAAQPGRHTLRVVDEQGRVDTASILVETAP